MVHEKYMVLSIYFGEGNGTPLQYSCLENPMGGGAWKAAVHGVTEGRTQLSNFTFTFHFHSLEKEIATHSRVLAWRIPGTEEPVRLPSMGSHRVRQTEATQQQQQHLYLLLKSLCHSFKGCALPLSYLTASRLPGADSSFCGSMMQRNVAPQRRLWVPFNLKYKITPSTSFLLNST